MTKEQAFWGWFVANEAQIRTAPLLKPAAMQALFIKLTGELQSYCPGLSFQMGGVVQKERRELFLTARGKQALFPAVEALAAAAPRMEHWLVFAHLQPLGSNCCMFVNNRKIWARQIGFLPLGSPDHKAPLRIRVYVPGYRPEEAEEMCRGVQDLLYALLGEKAAVCDLSEWELDDLANDEGKTNGLRRLADLEGFIRLRNQRTR